MLKTVAINLAEGAALVVVVLFLTLGSCPRRADRRAGHPAGDGRSRCIGMVRLGVTGNLMSLGAIDFGLLVDGAIVMLEVALVAARRCARRRRREDVAHRGRAVDAARRRGRSPSRC